MSEAPASEGSDMGRPYGKVPIMLWALLPTWNLYYILEYLPARMEFPIDRAIWTAVWLIIIALQYAFAYGLWRPKRWTRDVGIASLGLGMIMSISTLLTFIILSTDRSIDPGRLEVVDHLVWLSFYPVFWSAGAFYQGWRFLNRSEIKEYLESGGRPKTVPFRLTDREMPDTIRGRRPESVAWITEANSVGEIFFDEDHLIIVRSPGGPVGLIPMKDIVGLERGELRPDNPFDLAFGGDVLKALGLSLSGTVKVSKLRVTYMTESGLPSTVTLIAERKICPNCGGKMSLVAAGWYCKKDDHLIDPATNDLVQMIESRRPQKGSK